MHSIRNFLTGLFVFALAQHLSLSAAEGPATFKVGEVTFNRPATWEWVPASSPMRKAELRVKDDKAKSSADVVFFAGFGGSAKDNVNRWFGQFQEGPDKIHAKSEEKNVAGHKITYASAEGTYMSGMPGGAKTPQPGTGLLAAVIEESSGNIFVRMTGPAELVKRSEGDFKKMVESISK
jgi:hypothetical protein